MHINIYDLCMTMFDDLFYVQPQRKAHWMLLPMHNLGVPDKLKYTCISSSNFPNNNILLLIAMAFVLYDSAILINMSIIRR